jgi:hypothetical protein
MVIPVRVRDRWDGSDGSDIFIGQGMFSGAPDDMLLVPVVRAQ